MNYWASLLVRSLLLFRARVLSVVIQGRSTLWLPIAILINLVARREDSENCVPSDATMKRFSSFCGCPTSHEILVKYNLGFDGSELFQVFVIMNFSIC
jgi:hypothetical protein